MRAFILFVSVMLSLAGCGPQPQRDVAPSANRIVRLGDAEIKGLDPQKISDLASLRVAADQFEGLTRFAADGRAEAGLASSWAVSSDGLVWTFQLAPKIRFSDGQEITPAIFARTFTRLRDPATAAPQMALFESIVSVEAKDGGTVAVKLSQP
ncbi:MAG: ABC transporter substrate-binding protein [Parasphingorhabdus sp.]|nr:ABC transporter substrate-binding protein [Parasphingorhabdus sp.]